MLRSFVLNLMQQRERLIILLTFLLAITVTSLLYGVALPGQFLFDDPIGLEPIAKVHDWISAIDFLVSGHSGPLRRPIAMATFLPQHKAWPDHPESMLVVNIAIHLINMVVAFILGVGLARLRLPENDDTNLSLWIGLGVAVLWGLSPFLATTHLMIIQRVTSVSGLFVLTGLSAFVWAHLVEHHHPRHTILLIIIGLGLCTFLAAFSKENGALLPLLALVILWCWIPAARRPHTLTYRGLILLLAVIPGLMVLGYLLSIAPEKFEHGYGALRYFTPEQRLMMQPSILMDYLRNLLLPRAVSVTPFMDQIPPPTSWFDPPITLVGLLFWLVLMALAIALRRSYPALLLGVLFFLTGHLVESSIVGLELYFAHRNYIPSFGAYFALIFSIAIVPETYKKSAVTLLIVYTGLFVLVLWQATSTWGQPDYAAERWLNENPYSERAVQFLALQYVRKGELQAARQVFDDAGQRRPDLPIIQIQRTQICQGNDTQYSDLLGEVATRLKTARFQPYASTVLAGDAQGNPSQFCPQRDYTALATMADALLENKPYTNDALSYSHLLFTKAMASLNTENMTQAIDLLIESFNAYPHLDTAFYAASIMTNLGQDERTLSFLEGVRQRAPNNAIAREIWLSRLKNFIDFIENARQSRKTEVR